MTLESFNASKIRDLEERLERIEAKLGMRSRRSSRVGTFILNSNYSKKNSKDEFFQLIEYHPKPYR